MNRFSKVEYPNESGGGGSNSFSFPSFTNALGQTMSNMRSMQDFNEKMIDRQVQGLEEAGKLQTGLFSAIGGLNTYLSQYEGDKQYVDNIVKQYYTQLEEISKNPNDPYIKLKISDLGRKITADMTMGDLSKVINNAKIHAERTKDLESNKDVLKIDSGAGADYDIQNKNFKGTFSRDKDGKVSYNSLKYAPIAPALDIDSELAKYMQSVKPSTIPNTDTIEYATVEGNDRFGVIKINQIKGVDEATAFKNVKDYLRGQVNDPNNELRRRMVRDFNLKADGKDYVEMKDPSGKKIKASLEEYLDLEINNLAHLKKGRFVNLDKNTTSQIIDQIKLNNEDQKAKRDAVLDSLKAQDIQHGMYDRDRKFNAGREDEDFNRRFKLEQLERGYRQLEDGTWVKTGTGKGTSKTSELGWDVLNNETNKITMLNYDQLKRTKTGVDVVTDDALTDLESNKHSVMGKEYEGARNNYYKFLQSANKDIREYAPNYEKLKIADPNLKSVLVARYTKLLANSEFRNGNISTKASMLRNELNKTTKNGKPLNIPKREIPINNKEIVGLTSDPLERVIYQLEKEFIYQFNGKAVTGEELYKAKIAESMNFGSTISAYNPSGQNKDMDSYYAKVANSAINNKKLEEKGRPIDPGKEFGMANEEFTKLFANPSTVFVPNVERGTIEVTVQVPHKEGNVTTQKNHTFTIKDYNLMSKFAIYHSEGTYKKTGDASQLKNWIDIGMSKEDKIAKSIFLNNKGDNGFAMMYGNIPIEFRDFGATKIDDKKLNSIKEELNKKNIPVNLDNGKFVLIYNKNNDSIIGAYDYKTSVDKESKFNQQYYHFKQ